MTARLTATGLVRRFPGVLALARVDLEAGAARSRSRARSTKGDRPRRGSRPSPMFSAAERFSARHSSWCTRATPPPAASAVLRGAQAAPS